MTNLDKDAALMAEAKRLAVNPNALAASGLMIRVERTPYRPGFGDNAFPKVADRLSAAIFRALSDTAAAQGQRKSPDGERHG